MGTKTQVIFFIPPSVHMLDMSGPVHAFYSADKINNQYDIKYCSITETIDDSTGMHISGLADYRTLHLHENDYLFVPGFSKKFLDDNTHNKEWKDFYVWMNTLAAEGVHICSVCMGAFVLARAGLLTGKKCTTHWSVAQLLQDSFAGIDVQTDKLFVRDGNIFTSAGITSGIDLALFILEENHGPLFAHKVARELVVYNRRGGNHTQESVYLSYRNHLHNGIHQLQDWLIENLDKKTTLNDMGLLVNMSSRNLTRLFRIHTGISINEYITLLRIEAAGNLKNAEGITIDAIARRCGFENVRQLQRIWKEHYGHALAG
jgi:transcriptional regulator GlxA family with amidase domain